MGWLPTIVPWSNLWDCWPTSSRGPRAPWQSHAHPSRPRFGRGPELHMGNTTSHTIAIMMDMSTTIIRFLLLLLIHFIDFTIITTLIHHTKLFIGITTRSTFTLTMHLLTTILRFSLLLTLLVRTPFTTVTAPAKMAPA